MPIDGQTRQNFRRAFLDVIRTFPPEQAADECIRLLEAYDEGLSLAASSIYEDERAG